MPATSKAQWRFMKAVEHGRIKDAGLSKKEAREFTKGVDHASLPQHDNDALKRALVRRK